MRVIRQKLKSFFGFGSQNEAQRELWLEAALKKIPNGAMILDAGAGTTRYRKFCRHLRYVAQDFGEYDGQGNMSGLQKMEWTNDKLDIVSDITAIPRPDHSFDAIMCIEVLEHLPDARAAIAEFGRLVRPGGQLILTAPFFSLTHFAPYHFYSGFNRYFFEKVLPEQGFTILEISANGNYYELLAQELRRLPYVAKYHSRTRLWPWEFMLIMLNTLLLKRIADKNVQSEELLNFGFQIVAVKN